ncbi:MAG: hypothetical protein QY311_01635 [Candidatus Paceibacterota bacterium]|nr:MAG: hypothetical protein QY311_01635 [Candidatus Paceibacterota bacterium]
MDKWDDFFKKWSDDMAYALGFICADGAVEGSPPRYVSLYSTDVVLLRQLKKRIGFPHPVRPVRRTQQNVRWKIAYRVQIGSVAWVRDLEKLGVVANKSFSIQLPKIPKKFFASFVRGYFDGDGCISFGRYKRSENNAYRWTITSRFSSGSKDFLLALLSALRATGAVQSGFIYQKNRSFDLVFSWRDSAGLYALMYKKRDGETLFLPRKLKIFQKASKIFRQFDSTLRA